VTIGANRVRSSLAIRSVACSHMLDVQGNASPGCMISSYSSDDILSGSLNPD
jgi:hypothetical protein